MANIITTIRIILVTILFFIFQDHVLFLSLYLIAGFTDILDGYVARKLNQTSELGAKLDSFADIILVAFVIYYILNQSEQLMLYIPLVLILFVLKISVIGIHYIKRKEIIIVHTIMNKATGLLLFSLPLFLFSSFEKLGIWIVFLIGFITVIDELLIALFVKRIDLNQKSFFSTKD